MNKSESIKNIAAALAAAQAEMPGVQMNAVNPFLKNKFADLGAVISTARPILKEHGLSYSQMPYSDGNHVGIHTIIMHTSGEWIESSVSLELSEEKGKSAAQVAGSIITYLRRYSLASALGMYADEDSDGAQPVTTKKTGKAPDDGPVTVAAWEAWELLLKRSEAAGVPFDKIKKADVTLGQLRTRYKELEGFVKDAEEQLQAEVGE